MVFTLDEKAALVAIYTPNLGSMKWKMLKSHFVNESDIFEATHSKLTEVIGPKLASEFLMVKNNFGFDELAKNLTSNNIVFLAQNNPFFPASFLEIDDSPIGIFIKGNFSILTDKTKKIGVVGTRKPTSYGQITTRMIAKELCSNEIVIVSGMATGIDTIAHQEAVNQSRPTIAILGCGVNIVYPTQNKSLYENIIATGGAIISEFPPEKTVQKGLFITRNRLISAISSAILIVEGPITSGSMITAKYALEQGRDIYALPGPINQINSQGPNYLIKSGASPITSIEDLMSDLSIVSKEYKKNDFDKYPPEINLMLKKLIEAPRRSDELARELKIDTSMVLQSLTLLEIDVIVKKGSDAKYYLI